MEEIEVHSKSYLVRWVHAKPEHTISWTINPYKRSVNFGLFKHPGASGGGLLATGPPQLSTISSRSEETLNESVTPEVVVKLASVGLKQVVKLTKCEADKFTCGKYEVSTSEAGHYALVFDNTFSKNTSKTVTFFLLTYPTKCQNQISFGAQLHHSQAMASAVASAPPQLAKASPKFGAKLKPSADSLQQLSANQPLSPMPSSIHENPFESTETASIHTGVLQKRRRKKHQGYARRFFCLDYTSSTLSYYHDRNSSALRGAIPLSMAAIGTNAKTKEISIDSGAEIWFLRAGNNADFDSWKKALEKASSMISTATTPANRPSLDTDLRSFNTYLELHDRDWARLESLLSQISGTRDAVRRLCSETLASPLPSPPTRSEAEHTAPSERTGDAQSHGDEKRAFWKRKPSAAGANNNIFKRNVSASLAVPSPGPSESAIRDRTPSHAPRREENMHDHMKALLRTLDSVVQEFSVLVTDTKQRQTPIPQSAMSRLSLMSVESQEYFDAEERGLTSSDSRLLAIQHETESEDDEKEFADSDTSSEIDDRDPRTPAGLDDQPGILSSIFPPRSKKLTPLPLSPVPRRKTIKPPTIMPPSLIGFLRKNVGKDLSTISMPVSANEPTSLLQRAAEAFEYTKLLDHAAESADAQDRMLHVAAFAVSALASSRVKERAIRKPFNPMLGETYELVREDLNFRFVSEKVSHRPVQLAVYAEAPDWAVTHSPLPSQKFWGKSSEIITEGKVRLVLHNLYGSECFSWNAPTCFLRNIIAGEKYVEPVGSMTIQNETTGWKAVVEFKAKGMFGGRSEDVEVRLLDRDGSELPLGLSGTWTSQLCVKENGRIDTKREIWRAGQLVEKAEKHYGMTQFATGLNEVTEVEKGKLPPTDSRLRADQRALEDGHHDLAEKLKVSLEEGQRSRRKQLETNNEEWTPRFFEPVKGGDETAWKAKSDKDDGYWERRANGNWTNVVDVLSVN